MLTAKGQVDGYFYGAGRKGAKNAQPSFPANSNDYSGQPESCNLYRYGNEDALMEGSGGGKSDCPSPFLVGDFEGGGIDSFFVGIYSDLGCPTPVDRQELYSDCELMNVVDEEAVEDSTIQTVNPIKMAALKLLKQPNRKAALSKRQDSLVSSPKVRKPALVPSKNNHSEVQEVDNDKTRRNTERPRRSTKAMPVEVLYADSWSDEDESMNEERMVLDSEEDDDDEFEETGLDEDEVFREDDEEYIDEVKKYSSTRPLKSCKQQQSTNNNSCIIDNDDERINKLLPLLRKANYNSSRVDKDKPPYSYASLIAQAILTNPQRKLALSGIYAWIMDNYPYYQGQNTGWQNSIRHNLSLNKCFVKKARSDDEPGKGAYWTVDLDSMDDFEDGVFRRRKAPKSSTEMTENKDDKDGGDEVNMDTDVKVESVTSVTVNSVNDDIMIESDSQSQRISTPIKSTESLGLKASLKMDSPMKLSPMKQQMPQLNQQPTTPVSKPNPVAFWSYPNLSLAEFGLNCDPPTPDGRSFDFERFVDDILLPTPQCSSIINPVSEVLDGYNFTSSNGEDRSESPTLPLPTFNSGSKLSFSMRKATGSSSMSSVVGLDDIQADSPIDVFGPQN